MSCSHLRTTQPFLPVKINGPGLFLLLNSGGYSRYIVSLCRRFNEQSEYRKSSFHPVQVLRFLIFFYDLVRSKADKSL